MPNDTTFKAHRDEADMTSAVTLQKWGAIASFLLVVTFVVPLGLYLTGKLGVLSGPLAYDLADLLYGPVWGASLVVVVLALRERIGELAPRRMTLSLLAAVLATAAMITVACIRSANRHYHLMHPELNLEMSSTVLLVWTTLVAGVTAAGLHFLGWSFVLLGWAGWTTRRLPRVLSAMFLLVGIPSLFAYAYLRPDADLKPLPLAVVASIWLGILLWRGEPGSAATEKHASQPDPS
jgi:hypothetical protein